ncbi:5-methyltetrahydropteroyltriglutamate--homocysteine methyltransferase [Actinokineospora baliensis]|uniref:cobalamin-independent methionine synthase II family protein n=1 Tax=Actinokineospora baliensis TaxID=547056 RepID=UPI001956587A|nr:cobalamin-independent methionine synthase II family protein [Actinokineospora baliensis]MBM7774197.1 5-methyltetrahydropteroyltriglutamate--homocysteine methyltransferase [Actinokineospora baliensis]
MSIPTELIGSIPRPKTVLDALAENAAGTLDDAGLAAVLDDAVADTIRQLEAAGSPVVTDGEQSKPSFVSYPLNNLPLAPDGAVIPFADGHTRTLPRLTAGPFRYGAHASTYLTTARRHASVPVKQAVIAPSALSLIYPASGIEGYSQAQFLDDLVDGAEADIRSSLDGGADSVQLDFTEGRLSLKLDPSGGLLDSFVDLNNRVLERFSDEERARIGVHTCPGGDQDSVHSLDVDYVELLPKLFRLKAGRFYLQLASESDPRRVLAAVAEHSSADQRIFVGVTDPIDPRVETAEEVRDRVLAAAEFIPVSRLGTCDDCGFSPFADDVSTSREVAFAKVAARVRGTALAAEALGV